MDNNPIIKFPICPPNMAQVVSVENVSGIKALSNTFVYVTDINTVFFIDNQHRITTICAMPVFYNGYDYAHNPLNLRTQVVYDFDNNRQIIYDGKGNYRIIKMQEIV